METRLICNFFAFPSNSLLFSWKRTHLTCCLGSYDFVTFNFHYIILCCIITGELLDFCKQDSIGRGHVPPASVQATPPTAWNLRGILIQPWLISQINTQWKKKATSAFPSGSQGDGKQAATPLSAEEIGCFTEISYCNTPQIVVASCVIVPQQALVK